MQWSFEVCKIYITINKESLYTGLSHLKSREKELLRFLLDNHLYEFTPIDVSRKIGVTNKTVINRCVNLTANGFLVPIIVKTRIRSYVLSDFTREHETRLKEILQP